MPEKKLHKVNWVIIGSSIISGKDTNAVYQYFDVLDYDDLIPEATSKKILNITEIKKGSK